MTAASNDLIGVGLYSVAEAAQLTGATAPAIRRWLLGYRFQIGQQLREMPAVWQRDIPDTEAGPTLSFLDMMEIRFIRAFRKHGVSWPAIRQAAALACEMFEDNHPFTRRRFRTDGRRIFQEIDQRPGVKLFDMNRQSWVFREIVDPSLYRGVEFSADQMARWYPLYPNRAIIVDPARAFGRPTLAKEGIPTETLSVAAKVEGSAEAVARWYGISAASVKAAADFHERLLSA
jgi:uncharacterized protein (DUF433 family)/DNA-binding transcriptional MerR regulator